MITLKESLCLLAIFVAYGVAGRLDYEDAVLLEQLQKERQQADCHAISAYDAEPPRAAAGDRPFASIDPCAGRSPDLAEAAISSRER
ncbi:hypothetical protein P3W85_03170 [Cupriavidus basilensis]|uniref:Uncharacterized protein n=1 Tax=Cupriavidus basilensis TaxID=68895 RepID=A0ABT6AH86_9BURK|nr:hypothetical protein [Cupriavidus basilensis]MDF3831960.1 hypothetical protein [Cupriavidus basilensis]